MYIFYKIYIHIIYGYDVFNDFGLHSPVPSPDSFALFCVYTSPWYTSKRQFCNHDDRVSGYCDENDEDDARGLSTSVSLNLYTYMYKRDRQSWGEGGGLGIICNG